jgi:hypothetical protein
MRRYLPVDVPKLPEKVKRRRGRLSRFILQYFQRTPLVAIPLASVM